MAQAHHTPVLPEEGDIERVPKHPNLFLASGKVDHLPKETDQEMTLPMLLLRTLTRGRPGGKTKEIAIQNFSFPSSLSLSLSLSLYLSLSLSLLLSLSLPLLFPLLLSCSLSLSLSPSLSLSFSLSPSPSLSLSLSPSFPLSLSLSLFLLTYLISFSFPFPCNTILGRHHKLRRSDLEHCSFSLSITFRSSTGDFLNAPNLV